MKKVPIRCAGHRNLLAKYIPPCSEHQNGAFEVIRKCHGETCETIFSIPERLEPGAALMLGCAHEVSTRPPAASTFRPSN